MQVTRATNFWPYQVRRLLESWTVEELARALRKTPERIRQYVSGKAVPEPATQRDLLRMITTYCKRTDTGGLQPPPRIVSENAPPLTAPDDEPWERGVYEDLHAPSGLRVFKVVGSTPGDVGTVIWPTGWVTPQFIANLDRGLNMRDPPNKLKAI